MILAAAIAAAMSAAEPAAPAVLAPVAPPSLTEIAQALDAGRLDQARLMLGRAMAAGVKGPAMDRLLGVVFGLVRGAVIIGLIVLAGRAAKLDDEPWWDATRSMPAAEALANWLERYAAPAAIELYEEAMEPPAGAGT